MQAQGFVSNAGLDGTRSALDTVPADFAIHQETEVTVSAGETHRLPVPATALLRDRGGGRPGVLLVADEPTAALDTGRGTEVMVMLRRIARERGSAVITDTHGHRMIEGFDTVYRLEDGVRVDVQRHTQPV